MACVFITGSTEGLGRDAARTLMREDHVVVLHARNRERATVLSALDADVVVGDLASAEETRGVAEQVNALGRMDAVIHNAGVYLEPKRGNTPEGRARTVAINVLAPWLLTAWIERPARLIYLSSGLHRGARASLDDLDWTRRRWNADQAYADSKLQITALALALARRWRNVLSHSVDPGWVPTRMGGPSAPDDLELGHLTQTWLAVSEEPAAKVSGGYWHHRRREEPAAGAANPAFQDELVEKLVELTGVDLP